MNSSDIYSIVKNMRQEDVNKIQGRNIIGKEIFISTRDGKTRALIYRAKNTKKPSPVFFNVHGGGFIKGLPENDDKFCDDIRNDLNITVISIDYRLAPEYKWPAGIYDTYDVVEYVSSHSNEFEINPNNMSIGGHSAGGNISTVVCMLAKENNDFSFKCQILDYPPLDVYTAAEEKFYIEGAIPPKIASIYNECYRNLEDANKPYCSPVFASIDQLRNLPPAVVITAEIDSLRDEAENYAQMLIKAGVETTAKRFYGVPHGFTISKPELQQSKEAYKMIATALKRYI